MILLTLSRGKGKETVRLQLPASPAEIGEAFASLDRISHDTTATAILDVSGNVPVLYSGTGDVAAYEGKTSLDESHGLVEWQADALATALLMPLPQIKRSFYRLRAGRSNEQLVAEMAQIFQVSKQAMRIRLETHNLI